MLCASAFCRLHIGNMRTPSHPCGLEHTQSHCCLPPIPPPHHRVQSTFKASRHYTDMIFYRPNGTLEQRRAGPLPGPAGSGLACPMPSNTPVCPTTEAWEPAIKEYSLQVRAPWTLSKVTG